MGDSLGTRLTYPGGRKRNDAKYKITGKNGSKNAAAKNSTHATTSKAAHHPLARRGDAGKYSNAITV
jgi:hypothetical protein